MSISPLVIAWRTIGVAPRPTRSVTSMPASSSTSLIMLPRRLPSVSIFEPTTTSADAPVIVALKAREASAADRSVRMIRSPCAGAARRARQFGTGYRATSSANLRCTWVVAGNPAGHPCREASLGGLQAAFWRPIGDTAAVGRIIVSTHHRKEVGYCDRPGLMHRARPHAGDIATLRARTGGGHLTDSQGHLRRTDLLRTAGFAHPKSGTDSQR